MHPDRDAEESGPGVVHCLYNHLFTGWTKSAELWLSCQFRIELTHERITGLGAHGRSAIGLVNTRVFATRAQYSQNSHCIHDCS